MLPRQKSIPNEKYVCGIFKPKWDVKYCVMKNDQVKQLVPHEFSVCVGKISITKFAFS